jgi:hypothetical protein
MMEGCSVCTCPEEEIPKSWIFSEKKEEEDDFGWVSSDSSSSSLSLYEQLEQEKQQEEEQQNHLDSLGKISLSGVNTSPFHRKAQQQSIKAVNTAQKTSSFFSNLYKTEDCEDFGKNRLFFIILFLP